MPKRGSRRGKRRSSPPPDNPAVSPAKAARGFAGSPRKPKKSATAQPVPAPAIEAETPRAAGRPTGARRRVREPKAGPLSAVELPTTTPAAPPAPEPAVEPDIEAAAEPKISVAQADHRAESQARLHEPEAPSSPAPETTVPRTPAPAGPEPILEA